MAEEYTVEVYKELNEVEKANWISNWKKQAFVGNTYEECEQFIEENPIDEPYYYSIWCIEYDEHENEVKSYPVY